MHETIVDEVGDYWPYQAGDPGVPREDDLAHLGVDCKHDIFNCLIKRHPALLCRLGLLLLMDLNAALLARADMLEHDRILAEVGVNCRRTHDSN